MSSLLSRWDRRRRTSLAIAFTICMVCATATAQVDRAKRVLVLNSTRPDEQFSMVSARELPTLLAERLGERVDYYNEYFDFQRFPPAKYSRLYLDFLKQKYDGRRFDLLILMGGVTVDFMTVHRNAVLGDTPAIYYSLTPPDRIPSHSTGIINQLHFKGSIDLALALQPDLTRVYVVSGAGESDRRYEDLVRAEFSAFKGRIEFVYLSGLVTADLEARLRALPPRSAVFFAVASQDGAGEHFQQMDYLSRIAAAANAPTYSWADAAVDTGIVGGSRRDQLAQSRAIAALAVRVLRGEHAEDIPVTSLDTDAVQVDWRTLRRWGIDESRVPAGARLLFRVPTVWEQYERYIVGAVMLMGAQAVLIAGLLVQRGKRHRAELQLRGSQNRLRDSYNRIRHLSRQLLLEQEAERARISRELHDDINQQLAILSIELDRVRSESPLEMHGAKLLAEAMDTAHTISKSVRELSHRLHPPRLTPGGLVTALQTSCRELSPPHLPIAFRHHAVPAEIDQNVALCLFRVAQEALVNAVKHSDAQRISIDLIGEPSRLVLTITDDGKGFVADGVSSTGLGLMSMRERVESVGGVLEVHASHLGTRLKVIVPTQVAESARPEIQPV